MDLALTVGGICEGRNGRVFVQRAFSAPPPISGLFSSMGMRKREKLRP